MKKIIFTIAIIFGGLVSAQDYYDTYPQDYNGYEYYDQSYDYPDEYYYNYPTDYYPDHYYQGYYNDYRNAVFSINWDRFFLQYNLTPWQIDQIIALNNRFANYAAWNTYYRWNPDRWYYDRFYALQNILGPRVFVVYQNVYFRGRSPIVFYRNRCANFYAVRYPVRPVYRNVNINIYRLDRNNFREGFRNPGRNMGMIQPDRNNGIRNPQTPRSGANGNNIGNIRSSENNGIRNQNDNIRSSGNVRENDNIRIQPNNEPNSGVRNGGFRNGNDGVRRNTENTRENNNFRNQTPERRIENRGNGRSEQRNTSPSERGNRGSGNRLVSRF